MFARYRRKTDVAKKTLWRFARDESAATSLEYGLIAGFISVAILSAVFSMGDNVSSIFSGLSSDLEAAASGTNN